jgi:hypothetical protein
VGDEVVDGHRTARRGLRRGRPARARLVRDVRRPPAGRAEREDVVEEAQRAVAHRGQRLVRALLDQLRDPVAGDLRTASPEDIEATHAEAFDRLTPEQRRQVLAALTAEVSPAERARPTDDPRSMACAAIRTELRRPGAIERALGSRGIDGRSLLTGLLDGVAAAFVGSMLIDGLVDPGFGDGGLIDLGPDEPFGGFFDGFGF